MASLSRAGPVQRGATGSGFLPLVVGYTRDGVRPVWPGRGGRKACRVDQPCHRDPAHHAACSAASMRLNWKTVYNRHRGWSLDGTWERILNCLRAGCDGRAGGGADWAARTRRWCARTSTPRAPAAPGPPIWWSRGAPPNDKNPPGGGTNREALGRSRGGLSTKIHLAADRRCRPVTRILTPGQHDDCPQFIPLMEQIRIARRGKGRPRTRRRPPARLRPRTLQGAQHRRALLRQAYAIPRCRHPLRQARAHLPGHYRRRLNPDLATRSRSMIYGTRPTRSRSMI